MTQERQPINQPERSENYSLNKRTAKRGGLVGTLVIGAAVIMGGSYALGEGNKTNGATGSQSPSASLEATPRPSESGATPETSAPSAEANTYTILDQNQVNMGESKVLPANTVIEGDVFINGEFMADSDALSGLVVVLKEQAEVKGGPTWGYSYQTLANSEQAERLAVEQKNFQEQVGCEGGNGCDHSDIIHFPGDPKQSELSVDGETVTPSASPEVPSSETKFDDKTLALMTLLNEGKIDVSTPEGRALMELLIKCLCACEPEQPAPTPTPEAEVCPPSKDIEHAYEGWNSKKFDRSKAPKETESVSRAIFQSDGAWKFSGEKKWNKSYDSNGSTAQIYVFEFEKPKKVDFSFDWGGDLQLGCPKDDFDKLLQKDIDQTFKRDEIKSIKVTYVAANGKTKSEVIKK